MAANTSGTAANAPSLGTSQTDIMTEFSQSEVGRQYTPQQLEALQGYLQTGQWGVVTGPGQIENANNNPGTSGQLATGLEQGILANPALLAQYQQFQAAQGTGIATASNYANKANTGLDTAGTILTGAAANPYASLLGGQAGMGGQPTNTAGTYWLNTVSPTPVATSGPAQNTAIQVNK